MRQSDVVYYYRALKVAMKDHSREELGEFCEDNSRQVFGAVAIWGAEPQFGDYLSSEIIDECGTQIPGTQAYCNAPIDIGPAVFSPVQLKMK